MSAKRRSEPRRTGRDASWQAVQEELARLRSELRRRDARLQEAIDALRTPAGKAGGTEPGSTPADERAAYERLKRGFRSFVRRTIPRGARVAVASRGDDAMVAVRGVRAEHFPQAADGSFAGYYPPDGTSAIVHVEGLRAKGIEYLVFPQTAAWWLEAYPRLARHLNERYEIAGRAEDVAIAYRLARTSGQCAAHPVDRVARLVDSTRDSAATALSVLDWQSGLGLAERLPDDAVFSPGTKGSTLPYLAQSIDVVVLGGMERVRLKEARRVARLGVVHGLATGRDADAADGPVLERVGEQTAQRPSASIIIPTYNGIRHLDACLRALQETLPDPFNGEVIVVDDASAGPTSTALRQRARRVPWLRVLRNARNLGFISSCNRGARAAQGEHLVFLNDDTIPQPDWLDALLRTFAMHPDAGAVGGRLVYPDGRLQEAGGVIFRDGSGANFGRGDYDVDGPLYAYVRRVSYCSGALLATPASLFRELGGFDRRYRPAYYEDTDYCFSVREAGRTVCYQPESVVIHLEGATAGTDEEHGVKRHQVVNRRRFLRKWRHRLATLPEKPTRYTPATWHELAALPEVA